MTHATQFSLKDEYALMQHRLLKDWPCGDLNRKVEVETAATWLTGLQKTKGELII